jgi:hypothetical protein
MSHATGGVRADRVGAKLSARAIAPGGAAHGGRQSFSRPLTREISAGSPEPPVAREAPEREPALERENASKLRIGATRSAVCGVRVIRGRARGSWWLQTSARGVRPFASRGDEPLDTAMGLAAPGESRGAVNARREPRFGGKAEVTVAGSSKKRAHARAVPRSTCRRKALWIEEAVLNDERAGEAVLGTSNDAGRQVGEARGATESVRGPSPVSYAVDNAAAGWRSSGSALCTFRKRRAQEEGSKRTKAEVAPSSALHSGLGRRKAGRRRGELEPSGSRASWSTRA